MHDSRGVFRWHAPSGPPRFRARSVRNRSPRACSLYAGHCARRFSLTRLCPGDARAPPGLRVADRGTSRTRAAHTCQVSVRTSGPGVDSAGRSVKALVCNYGGIRGRVHSFNLRFDGQENDWYTGTDTPPSTSKDLSSATAHEFGHATGFLLRTGCSPSKKHWEKVDGTNGDNTSWRHTMCAGWPGFDGAAWYRTLNTHDLHTFTSRY